MPYKVVKTKQHPCIKCDTVLTMHIMADDIHVGYCDECKLLNVLSRREGKTTFIGEVHSVYKDWKE